MIIWQTAIPPNYPIHVHMWFSQACRGFKWGAKRRQQPNTPSSGLFQGEQSDRALKFNMLNHSFLRHHLSWERQETPPPPPHTH